MPNPPVTVSTVAALNTAISNAGSGDTIYLSGGNWDTALSRTATTTFSKTNPVRLAAADPTNPPKFTTIAASGKPAWEMTNHTGFIIDGIALVGEKYSELATYAGGPFPTARAMNINSSHGITIQNCLFDFWKENMNFVSGTYSDIVFRCNEIRRQGMDAIRVYKKIDRFLCEKNYVHSPKIFTGINGGAYDCNQSAKWNSDNGRTHPCGRHHNYGQHPDVIQYALNGTDSAGSDHIIRYNYFRSLDYATQYSHNIFIYNERVHASNSTAADAFLMNLEVANNIIYCGHWNALALCGIRGNSSVHHNKIIGYSPKGTCNACGQNLVFTPKLQIYEGVGTASQKVLIYNNHYWESDPDYQGSATSDGITYTNNVKNKNEDEFPAGFVTFTYGRYSDGTQVIPAPEQLTIATRPATQTAFALHSGQSGVASATLPIIGTPSTSTSSNNPPFTNYQTGDIILAFAANPGAASNITVPAGWTVAGAELDGPSMTSVLAWRYAASNGADTLGTWTGASFVKYVPIASVAPTNAVRQAVSAASASGPTITHPALPSPLSGKSAVLTFTIQRLNTEGAMPGTRSDMLSIDSRSAAGGPHYVIARNSSPLTSSTAPAPAPAAGTLPDVKTVALDEAAYTIGATSTVNFDYTVGSGTFDELRVSWHIGNASPKPRPSPDPAMVAIAAAAGDYICAHTTSGGAVIGEGTTTAYHNLVPEVIGLDVWSGKTGSRGRLASQLRRMLTTDRDPTGKGGLATQYDLHMALAILCAKFAPGGWWESEFTSTERGKFDLIMEGLAYGAAFSGSASANSSISLTGEQNQPKNTPNWRTSIPATLWAWAAYRGGYGTPDFAGVLTKLTNFSKSAFYTSVSNAGLNNLAETFKSRGGATGFSGPTNAVVEAALDNWQFIARTGSTHWALSDVAGILKAELEFSFSNTIESGLNGGDGVNYKGDIRGIIMSGADDLPNKGLVGMLHQLDTTDGGGANSTLKNRSAMSYAVRNYNNAADIVLACLIGGIYDPSELSDVTALADRCARGVTDFAYKHDKGYKSFSKGGGTSNNEDWVSSDSLVQSNRVPLIVSVWWDIVDPALRGDGKFATTRPANGIKTASVATAQAGNLTSRVFLKTSAGSDIMSSAAAVVAAATTAPAVSEVELDASTYTAGQTAVATFTATMGTGTFISLEVEWLLNGAVVETDTLASTVRTASYTTTAAGSLVPRVRAVTSGGTAVLSGTASTVQDATTPVPGTWPAQNVASTGGNTGQGHSWAIEIDGLSAGSNSLTSAITMPVDVTAGQTLVTVLSSDGSPTLTLTPASTAAGWVSVKSAAYSTTVKQQIFANFNAVGDNELGIPGDALSVTFSAAEAFTAITYAYSGARSPLYVELSGADGANSNPPSLTPAGGGDDYAWLVTRSGDGTVIPTAAPAGFSDMRHQVGSATSASTTVAEREFNGTVLDPGAFVSATEQYVVGTVAIPPTLGYRPAYHGAILTTYAEQIDWLGDGVNLNATSGIITIAPDTPAYIACAGVANDLDLQWKQDSMSNWKPTDKATSTGKDADGNLVFRIRPDFTAYNSAYPDAHRLHAVLAGQTLANIRIRYKASKGTVYSPASAYTLSFTAQGDQAFTATPLVGAMPALGTPVLAQQQTLAPRDVLAGIAMPGLPLFYGKQIFVAPGLVAGPHPVIDASALTSVHAFGATPLVAAQAVLGTPTVLQVGGTSSQAFEADPLTAVAPALGSPVFAQRQIIPAFSLTAAQAAMGAALATQSHTLTAASLTAAQAAMGAPALTQVQQLVGAFVAAQAVIGTPTLGQAVGTGGLVADLPDLTGYRWAQNANFVPQSVVAPEASIGTPALAQTNPEVSSGWDRDWRKHLRKARRTVHDHLGIRAVYALNGTQTGRIVRVRPRFKLAQNEADGSSMNDTDMKILFDRAEVPMPMVNAYIAFAGGEIYKIRDAEAPYMGYVTVSVVPVPEAAAQSIWPHIVPGNFR